MTDTITPAQTGALAKLAEIPAVGSAERERWLDVAEELGFDRTDTAVVALMSEARKQGQRDCLGASSETTGLSPDGHAPMGHEPAAVDPSRGPAASYGIIDPDYARVFTIARCLAWQEGYALLMHGSFTRDLDLLAVPWEDRATDAEHLVKRIAFALDELDILVKDERGTTVTQKPHGRQSWTLTFKAFGDPRFIDLGVMPALATGGARHG